MLLESTLKCLALIQFCSMAEVVLKRFMSFVKEKLVIQKSRKGVNDEHY